MVLGIRGDALLFKNDRVLHGRDAFTGERWLQRAYFTDSLTPFRERMTESDAAERDAAESNAFVFDAARAPLRLPKTNCAAEQISCAWGPVPSVIVGIGARPQIWRFGAPTRTGYQTF